MLNLARKYRSKHFDEVVGQPLVVRLVKNSLYRDLVFPVYLLSGTRGCGKTSVARIFAAALNCEQLEQFQKNPQLQIPCLACASCKAMQKGNHPDFIEMDAASHTGVDNVRDIIDAAACVPVMGKRKIYLIDEAHMLSKAAFNALLKILEEPPASVVFMLATTDPHKILETVISRCFQLFFDPINHDAMVQQLALICSHEGITIEPEALAVIAQETEGSLRDALNLLERLRIAYEAITKQAVIELLGSMDDETICELLELVIASSPQELLAACERIGLPRYTASVVWKKVVEHIRLALWLKQGVSPDDAVVNDRLKAVARNCSYEKLIKLFEICYEYELSFAKTALPGNMLEMMLLKMTQVGMATSSNDGSLSSRKQITTPSISRQVSTSAHSERSRGGHGDIVDKRAASEVSSVALETDNKTPRYDGKAIGSIPNELAETSLSLDTKIPSGFSLGMNGGGGSGSEMPQQPTEVSQEPMVVIDDSPWQKCVRAVETLQDPLVTSLFKQGSNEKYDSATGRLEVIFSQDLSFFKEWLENTKKSWEPLIQEIYGQSTVLIPHFVGPSTKERPLKLVAAQPMQVPQQRPVSSAPAAKPGAPAIRSGVKKAAPAVKEKVVSVNQDMPLAQLVSQAFPGTIVTQDEP